MLADRITLAQFLSGACATRHAVADDLKALIVEVSRACAAVAREVAHGALAPRPDGVACASVPSANVACANVPCTNIQGEVQHRLDVVANDIFLWAGERSGRLAGMVSEELARPHDIPADHRRGRYLLLFDPLDGSSNIEINVAVGSIFSVLDAPRPGDAAAAADFLQPGAQQVCAGYAIYGPTTMLVLSTGAGTHAFTLDSASGAFVLTHADLTVPDADSEFAINASNSRFWEPPVRNYIGECLLGRAGARGKDFNMRWVASLVADAHRILMRGGVFLYPRDTPNHAKAGRLRLLYEASPIAFLIEQAGGRAGTGRERILDIAPSELHQRVPLVFGARGLFQSAN